MSRFNIYMYRDSLANIYNVAGTLIMLSGISFLLRKTLAMGFFTVLLGLVLTRKAACRATGIPLRIKAKTAAVAMVILAVLQLADRLVLHSKELFLTVSGISLLLLPLVIAAALLLPAVKNKLLCTACILFVYQVLVLLTLLSDGSLAIVFASSPAAGAILLATALLPLWGGLFLLLRARKLSPEEKYLFV